MEYVKMPDVAGYKEWFTSEERSRIFMKTPDHLTDADVLHFWDTSDEDADPGSRGSIIFQNIQRLVYWILPTCQHELELKLIMACRGIWKLNYRDRNRLLEYIEGMAGSEMHTNRARANVLFNLVHAIREASNEKIGHRRLLMEQIQDSGNGPPPFGSASGPDSGDAGNLAGQSPETPTRDASANSRRWQKWIKRAWDILDRLPRLVEVFGQLREAVGMMLHQRRPLRGPAPVAKTL